MPRNCSPPGSSAHRILSEKGWIIAFCAILGPLGLLNYLVYLHIKVHSERKTLWILTNKLGHVYSPLQFLMNSFTTSKKPLCFTHSALPPLTPLPAADLFTTTIALPFPKCQTLRAAYVAFPELTSPIEGPLGTKRCPQWPRRKPPSAHRQRWIKRHGACVGLDGMSLQREKKEVTFHFLSHLEYNMGATGIITLGAVKRNQQLMTSAVCGI